MSKPRLTGLIHLLGGSNLKDKLLTSASLGKAWIDGFRVRYGWNEIQPSSAAGFNWDDIDDERDACLAAGKKLSVSISAGIQSPTWVKAQTTTLTVDIGGGETDTLVVGCDPDYLALWQTFLTAFGARYDSDPTIACVFFTGRSEQLAEFHVTGTPGGADEIAWAAAATAMTNPETGVNFTDKSEALQYATRTVCGFYKAAFPNTPTMFTGGNPWGGGHDGSVDQNVLQDYVSGEDDGTFQDGLRGLCDSFLHATTDPTDIGLILPYPKGEQAISISSDTSRFYSGTDPGGTRAQRIFDLLRNGRLKGNSYVELWGGDVEIDPPDEDLDDVLIERRPFLIANAPTAGESQRQKTRTAGRKGMLVR